MKNEKQIVLFLKKNSNFNQTQIAAKINEKFIELGNPIILPINNKDLSQPLIIFNQGIINLTMNYNEVSFVLLEENYDKCFETMIEIIELLQYFSMDFVRLGYISTFIGDTLQKDNFKNIMFKKDSIILAQFNPSSQECIHLKILNMYHALDSDIK